MKQLLVLFLLTGALCFSQQQNFEQLDSLFELLDANHKMMGSFSILKEGKSVYNNSIGYQSITESDSVKATRASKYRIGSVTKTFTAVMIFQLVDEEKISLDDKLSQFYPNIKNASKINIANLLNHTSGIRNITRDPEIASWIFEPSSEAQMLSRIEKYNVDFEPSDKMEYSNTNYILLGYILERIEKKSYKEILKKRIVNKLKLKDTFYGGAINSDDKECQSYHYENGKLNKANETHLSNPGGAGAMVSSSSDLVIFTDALFNNKLLSETSFEKMTKVRDEMGSGIGKGERNGYTIYGHDGSIDGFQSYIIYVPKIKTALAISANASDYRLLPIIFKALDVVEGKTIELPYFNVTSINLTAQQVKAYEGIYESNARPFDITVLANGNILQAGPDPNQLKNLTATKKDEFLLEAMGVTLKFDLVNNRLLFDDQSGTPIVFTKK